MYLYVYILLLKQCMHTDKQIKAEREREEREREREEREREREREDFLFLPKIIPSDRHLQTPSCPALPTQTAGSTFTWPGPYRRGPTCARSPRHPPVSLLTTAPLWARPASRWRGGEMWMMLMEAELASLKQDNLHLQQQLDTVNRSLISAEEQLTQQLNREVSQLSAACSGHQQHSDAENQHRSRPTDTASSGHQSDTDPAMVRPPDSAKGQRFSESHDTRWV